MDVAFLGFSTCCRNCLSTSSRSFADGPGSGSAAVTYADGHLVFRYQSGEVALIEATPSAYRLKGSFKPAYIGKNPCWAQPVITGGRMYLRDQDKQMCYDVREK